MGILNLFKNRQHTDTPVQKQINSELIKSNVESAFVRSCQYLDKPPQTFRVKLFVYTSISEITNAQCDDFWNAAPITCECWMAMNKFLGECFYLLANRQYIEERAKTLPNYFMTTDEAFSQIFRLVIPIYEIQSYSVFGNCYTTQHISGGDPGRFIGASVNGVGFGEFVGSTPIKIDNKLHDHRFIIFPFRDYRDEKDGEISTLFFSIDSLETLIKLIPQKYTS